MMNLTLICPICNRSLAGIQRPAEASMPSYHLLECPNIDGHFYGTHAPTEAEARAILEKAQKELVDALSAKIALPIEQRRHNQLRVKFNQLFYFAKHVRDTFKRDQEQGVKTRDKEYAIDLLNKGLD